MRSGMRQDMKEDLRDGDKNVYMRDGRIATGVAVAIIHPHQPPQDPTSLAFFYLLPPNPRSTSSEDGSCLMNKDGRFRGLGRWKRTSRDEAGKIMVPMGMGGGGRQSGERERLGRRETS